MVTRGVLWAVVGVTLMTACRGGFPQRPGDACADVACSGHGTCAIVGGELAVCLCDDGYHAVGLECVRGETDADADGDADGDADADADADADVDAESPCRVGELYCGGACLIQDEENCGGCGVTCDAGETCVDGGCRCPGSGDDCDGTPSETCAPGVGCVDTQTDRAHCGEVFHGCAYGDDCVEGVCTCGGGPGCDRANEQCCGGRCTQTLDDSSHCGPLEDPGACERACPPGSECHDGGCGCGLSGECPGGQTCCDGTTCRDLMTDPNNCGACGLECDDGMRCEAGECICQTVGDCDDGDPCTEDVCNDSTRRCEHSTRDFDDDGYCDETCLDGASGSVGDCLDGDCDDGTDSRNPGRPDLCNGIDDDCDLSTEDGDGECSHPAGESGSDYCCGATPGCRTCCTDAQCPGVHNLCLGFDCACESGWTDCGGDCNCNTGGGDVCCWATCVPGGECCSASDCGPGDWTCVGNTCNCTGGMNCGGVCVAGAECCSASDCGPGDWTCSGNICSCIGGTSCGGTCVVEGECCSDADCGPGDWACVGNTCRCIGGRVCGRECVMDAECCDDGDCVDRYRCLGYLCR